MNNRSILIVDDESRNFDVIEAFLNEYDYELNYASSGQEALESLEILEEIDLILLDVMMPDMDGIEVCERIKAIPKYRPIPIIMVTALTAKADLAKCLNAGADDFISKPVNDLELRARVQSMLRLKQQYDALQVSLDRLLVLEAEKRELLENRNAELERQTEEAHLRANTDGLTQVFNRRCFDDRLQKEWRRVMRDQTCLSIILIDIDYFKCYNDFYGHLSGDDCLIRVAQTAAKQIKRPDDLFARYGGEEFVVLLPNTNIDGAILIAESIQQAIRNLNIPHKDSQVSEIITISMGIAGLIPTSDKSPEHLVALSDKALYGAKEQGRDRYVVGIP
ncbi:diguanylate cyclase domain-containing protein [Pseudanabaena minima]|uniref:diguanylate cyclase domain-containing protein n=1 Tax=Pseudanabaena minima TaxID=890415 RepID=UPI003DA806F9